VAVSWLKAGSRVERIAEYISRVPSRAQGEEKKNWASGLPEAVVFGSVSRSLGDIPGKYCHSF